MFKRQRVGSVVCPSCGRLVGIQDDRCYNCGRVNPGLWGFAPLLRRLGNDLGFVQIVIGGCTALYLITLVLSGAAALSANGLFSILSPSTGSLRLFGATGAVQVFGQWHVWTLLSAGWLHGSLLHILFNMMWVRQLAPVVGDMYGAGRMVIIYTIAGVCGFLLSCTATLVGLLNVGVPLEYLGFYINQVPISIGASASIFGLLGALVHYGRKSVSSAVTSQALTYAVVLFVFGLYMSGVDNYAHAGGFAGGYLASMWLNPLRPERADHLFAALLCVALVAASILASVILGLPHLR